MAFIINGKKIGDDVIEEEFDAIKDHFINLGEVVCCDRDEEFRGVANDNVVNRTLLEQASIQKFGETTDAEVEDMFAKLIEDHGGEENFFQNTGFNRGDEFQIKRKIRSTITVDKILEDRLGEETEPTEAELRGYYDENLTRFMTEEAVRVAQLFVEPKSHDAAKEAFNNLREVRGKILDGEVEFMDAAREHGSIEEENIDMGFMKQGETMPEIEAVVFSLRDGEVSPVVATHFGFHLLKILERKLPEAIPFDEVKAQLPEQFSAERRERRVNEFVAELKAQATIEEVEEEPMEV